MSKKALKLIDRMAVSRQGLLVLSATAVMHIAAHGSSQAAQALLLGQFSGGAHGVSIDLGVEQGTPLTYNSAEESCPCRGTNGVKHSTTVPSLAIGNYLTGDTNIASAIGTKTANSAATTESTTVTSVSLFDGLITADAITSEASVGATPNTLTTSTEGTKFVNLVIAGQAIDPAIPENTQVALSGLGTVTIKSVTPSVTAQNASLHVDGLIVTITDHNKYGLAVGSRIAVGDAIAGFSRMQPAAITDGYSLTANLSGDASVTVPNSGNIGAAIGIANCSGTGGVTETHSTKNFDIPGLATAMAAKVTAFGGPVGKLSVAKTTSTVSDVSLLNGLITADSLTAVAQESRSSSASTASTIGSGFTGLKVAGVTLPTAVRPNLTLDLPGFGFVTLNEQVITPASGTVRVTELDVFINQKNTLSIPVGTHLTLGTAFALAQKF